MSRMKVISIYLPEVLVDTIDELVKHGLYHSRGEAVRDIIRRHLQDYSSVVSLGAKDNGNKHNIMSIKLPPTLKELVKKALETGQYSSASELVRAALYDFLLKDGGYNGSD